MDCYEKLRILADGAKYDASCATSGVERKNVGRMGNASCAGICHSWSADGRCISLLKVLLTNKCVYDCVYCINRRTADVERASFESEELARLAMEFYRRNYIEGLFLSSAVEGSPDRTAERMLRCFTLLREKYGFAGYIHAKIIPGTSPELIHQIGMTADRVSVNIELPSEGSLMRLAPQKKSAGIFLPMKQIGDTIADRKQIGKGCSGFGISSGAGLQEAREENTGSLLIPGSLPPRKKYKERFAPAGQSTQMIIGASPETDRQIIRTTESLYQSFHMKRIYFSAYIPIHESPVLPSLLTPPPLLREHRLYQADWLMRFYGFTAGEILDAKTPFLDLSLDPKCAWALRHLELFPVEINKASLEELLRIPGVGTLSAKRIIRQRRMASVKFDDLKKIGVVVKRARYFITCNGRYYGGGDLEPEYLRGRILNFRQIRESLLPINDDMQISMFTEQAKLGSQHTEMIPEVLHGTHD
ncbi:MAG: putative DNA modification/repair radical SAM protein [Eubacteriales bacterium]|nr:putative DNA modification/repair radical SAM protein [Eubacteriales bacterium]MDD4583496.1 putative DNA modification/repair radical SAM protein [Eubacteriales bacterium]